MSVSNSKQINKTQSEKPENPADSVFGSDPDSQPVNLYDILELLKKLRSEVNKIRTEFTGIRFDISAILHELTIIQST